MAPGMRRNVSDQPRYKKPRAKNSSEIGAATQNATSSNHNAPSARADLNTSIMKPGVDSRPVARDNNSHTRTSSASAPTPIAMFFQEARRKARYSVKGVPEMRIASQSAQRTAGR